MPDNELCPSPHGHCMNPHPRKGGGGEGLTITKWKVQLSSIVFYSKAPFNFNMHATL
jgi:hypothetical protein